MRWDERHVTQHGTWMRLRGVKFGRAKSEQQLNLSPLFDNLKYNHHSHGYGKSMPQLRCSV